MAQAIINIFVPMNIHRWWQQQHIYNIYILSLQQQLLQLKSLAEEKGRRELRWLRFQFRIWPRQLNTTGNSIYKSAYIINVTQIGIKRFRNGRRIADDSDNDQHFTIFIITHNGLWYDNNIFVCGTQNEIDTDEMIKNTKQIFELIM